jgi:hypothetical protein
VDELFFSFFDFFSFLCFFSSFIFVNTSESSDLSTAVAMWGRLVSGNCSDLPTRNKIRNTMHKKVCESVKKISKYYFREVDMDLINGLCAEYLPLKVGVHNPRRRGRGREEDEEGDSMVRRRADLGFKGRVRSVLVDCTTASPLAKEVKDYKPGKAADAATKRKVKDYQRFYDIQQTNRCFIFFFAVETAGGLARDYVELLAIWRILERHDAFSPERLHIRRRFGDDSAIRQNGKKIFDLTQPNSAHPFGAATLRSA